MYVVQRKERRLFLSEYYWVDVSRHRLLLFARLAMSLCIRFDLKERVVGDVERPARGRTPEMYRIVKEQIVMGKKYVQISREGKRLRRYEYRVIGYDEKEVDNVTEAYLQARAIDIDLDVDDYDLDEIRKRAKAVMVLLNGYVDEEKTFRNARDPKEIE